MLRPINKTRFSPASYVASSVSVPGPDGGGEHPVQEGSSGEEWRVLQVPSPGGPRRQAPTFTPQHGAVPDHAAFLQDAGDGL